MLQQAKKLSVIKHNKAYEAAKLKEHNKFSNRVKRTKNLAKAKIAMMLGLMGGY